jgi:hypothetical protein
VDLADMRISTARALGLTVEDVNYITTDLLDEYRRTAQNYWQIVGENSPNIDGIFTAYGNSITFQFDQVFWKQDPFYGNPEFSACGDSLTAQISNSFATTFILKGKCSITGKHWFFIGNHME